MYKNRSKKGPLKARHQINHIKSHHLKIYQKVISYPVKLKDAKKWQRIYSIKPLSCKCLIKT